MTLKSLMAADIDDVFLNTDEHAEEVLFTPVNGPQRSITAVIDEKPSEIREDGNHLLNLRVISVFVKRDATTGISAPAMGDTLQWDGKTFSYDGPITMDSDQDGVGLTLKFTCPVVVNSGPQHRYRF